MSNSQKKTLFSCIPKRILSLAIIGIFLVPGSTLAITNSSLSLPPQGEVGDIITVDYWNAIINGLQNLDRRTREIYADPSGNVVIGGAEKSSDEYTIPEEKLDIKGAIKIGTTNTRHSGTIRFDSIEKDFEGYTGEEWKSLTKGGNGSGGKCTFVDSGVAFTTDIASASCASGSISYSSVEWKGKDGYFPSIGIKSSQTSASINCLGNACKLRLICCEGGAGSGGENDVLAQLNCAEGNVPKWDANLAKWSCGEDSGAGKLPWSELLGNVYRQEGNVGIGTDHPVHKLDVRDDIYMNQKKVATEPWVLTQKFLTSFTEIDPQVGNNTQNFLSKWDGNALVKSEIFENGGNVGIGTNNPKGRLDINGEIVVGNGTSDGTGVTFKSNEHTDYHIDNYEGRFRIFQPGNERFTVDTDGKVGIGTTDPDNKLTLRNAGDVNGANSGGGFLIEDVPETGDTFRLRIDPNEMQASRAGKKNTYSINPFGGNVYMAKGQVRAYEDGYLGVFGSNEHKLRLYSDEDYYQTRIIKRNKGGAYSHDFEIYNMVPHTPTAESPSSYKWVQGLTIKSDTGKVGIGTRDPSEKLEVNGKVKATAFVYASDRRLKKNIVKIKDPLQKIDQIKGVTFNWRDSGKSDIGVIAQDVEKIFPVAVSTNPETGIKAVDYPRLVPLLVASIKAQQKISQDQELQIQKLEKQIQRLSQ